MDRTLRRRLAAIKRLLLRLENTPHETDRARRNARAKVLAELRALRAGVVKLYPVERRSKYRYEAARPCENCALPQTEHGDTRSAFACEKYVPKAKRKLTAAQRAVQEKRSLRKRGLELLLRRGQHMGMCALAGIPLHERQGEWWGPAWINELPVEFSEHLTKTDLNTMRRNAAFRKSKLAELTMKRRQGVIQ